MEPQANQAEPRGRHGTARPPSRKPYKRVSIQETVDILALSKKGVSASEIARAIGISVERVAERIRAHASTTDTAMSVLQAASHSAAVEWVKSFVSARKRGEHRPMKDCLIATGVVSPDPQNQGVTVIVGGGDPSVMIHTHTSSSHAPNTLQPGTHNQPHDILIPHEPL